jgi:hypothetical protein
MRKAKQQLFVNHLLQAVKFISHAQKGKGDEMATHCMIRYGQIIAFDRTLAAGTSVVEQDLDCCPQTDRLLMALERCGEEHVIVQQDQTLTVRSGEFVGHVPLADPSKLPVAVPDPQQAPLGDAFRAALKVCGSLVKDSAPTVLQSCIQLNPYSCVSTNGNVILEAWHGFDFPPGGLLIPKAFADAVLKIRKTISGFGFSSLSMPGAATFTVHFSDGSWLRTNRYKDKIPDMLARLVPCSESTPFPAEFFRQVADIAKWSEDGRVYLDDSRISSHPQGAAKVGSELSFPMPEMRQGMSYSISSIKAIAPFATSYNDSASEHSTMFFGHSLRGAIAHESLLLVSEELRQKRIAAGTKYIEEQAAKICDCGSGLTRRECDCIPF